MRANFIMSDACRRGFDPSNSVLATCILSSINSKFYRLAKDEKTAQKRLVKPNSTSCL